MLKARIITAICLIPLVIFFILFSPPLTFLTVSLLFSLLAGWEWSQLAGLTKLLHRYIFLALLAVALLLSFYLPISYLVLITFIGWLFASLLLLLYPKGRSFWSKSVVIRSVMGFLVIIPCWRALLSLQGYSPTLLLYCLMMIWATDTAAYFVGKKWGKHKLAAAISPQKTLEGFFGGVLATIFFAVIGWFIFNVEQWILFGTICLLGGGLLTVLGDLFESMLKREAHIKESGFILPGHGGILDRIDSMTISLPFFALFFIYLFGTR